RGEGFPWFLPPPAPGTMPVSPPRHQLDPSANRLEPGLYAVSATLVKGLPWRVYDSPWKGIGEERWAPYQAWFGAFAYFDRLKPIAKVGHSIWIYRVTAEDAERLSEVWNAPSRVRSSATSPGPSIRDRGSDGVLGRHLRSRASGFTRVSPETKVET
ncbi:MAG: hypothetical protein AB7I30_23735, partial [Isosphaeraceae bacterium]